jgi:SynChlorMet cassette radical SAM/SPASM protein ScmF
MTDSAPAIPSLGTIYMYASGACNLNCSHCWIDPVFQSEGGKSSLHLSPELVKKAVAQAKPLGLHSVKLTGGEPLLNPNIRDIIQFISDESIGITMESNGTLVTRELAQFLASTPKFSFMSVSLDGADPKTHEDLRGVEGSFEKAVQGIGHLVEAGFKPQLICTLHRGNISQIEGVIQLAKELGCGSVKFNHVQHTGRGMDFDEDNALGVAEIIEINGMMEDKLIPSAGISVFPDIPLAFQKPARLLRSNPGRCHIHNIIGLLANGDLALCGIGTSMEDLLYGNLNTDTLADIWNNSPKLQALRRLVPDDMEGICSRCIHRRFCKGCCVAGNYNDSGKLNAPYFFCSKAEELGLFPKSRIAIICN